MFQTTAPEHSETQTLIAHILPPRDHLCPTSSPHAAHRAAPADSRPDRSNPDPANAILDRLLQELTW